MTRAGIPGPPVMIPPPDAIGGPVVSPLIVSSEGSPSMLPINESDSEKLTQGGGTSV